MAKDPEPLSLAEAGPLHPQGPAWSPIVVTDRARKRLEITDRAPRRISVTELAQALGAQVVEGPRRKSASPIGLIAQAEKVGRMVGREAAAVPAETAKQSMTPKRLLEAWVEEKTAEGEAR